MTYICKDIRTEIGMQSMFHENYYWESGVRNWIEIKEINKLVTNIISTRE